MSQTTPPPTPAPEASRPDCDVVVIGGGPAGSTVAALLARQGRSVVLLEKSHHPRFHIGESLLPANLPLFDQLGVGAQVQAIGMQKWGIEFVAPDSGQRTFYEFGDAMDKRMPMAWQVRRSQLDEILFRHAAACGALTQEGCQAQQVAFDADGATVHAVREDGSARRWRARYVVDASGRDTLLARQFGTKQRDPRHNSAAIYGHFTGAHRLAGRLEGDISVFWFEHGWFWFIPLADGSTSVGATCWPYYLKARQKPLREFFFDTLAMSPELQARLEGARLLGDQVHATGNFCYAASACTGPRWMMLGDAYGFIDPVFSAGVYLAMAGAFRGAELVATGLDAPEREPAARRRFEAFMRKGPRAFSWFIFRMTNPAMRKLFLNPRDVLGVKAAVLSMLAGDIYGGSPIRWPLRYFKLIYYASSLRDWRRTWAARQARRRNIADVGPTKGENVMVQG